MISLNIDNSKSYTLVGAGCSHTQGCAFTVYKSGKFKWATEAIKKKYSTNCTPEFITDNLTWMSKLSKYIPTNKIVNFGLGGSGTTSSLRHIKTYLLNKKDVKDHIFIIQLQSVYRNEIMTNIFSPHTVIDSVRAFLNRDVVDSKFRRQYAELLFDEQIQEAKYFRELLYLQDTLVKLGAQVRIFFQPWYRFPNFSEHTCNNIDGMYQSVDQKSFDTEELKIKDIITSLNIIDLTNSKDEYDIGALLGKNIRPTLHNEKLIPDDHHLSELGNELVAKSIFYNIDNKFKYYDEETLI